MSRKLLILFSFALIVALGFASMQKIDVNPTDSKAPQIVTDNSGNYVPSRPPVDNINAIWTESFNTLALPTGWLNLQESGTGLWTFLASGTYPTTTPHSGAGMASFQSWSYSSGCIASLVSATFSLTAGQGKLGFWMVRDAGYATSADKVDFMINTAPNSTGATLLGTINRSKTLTPVETGADGWYYYEFTIPASFNTATNYIVLKATSAYGNNMYVDDVSVSLMNANDIQTLSIDAPTSNVQPGAITPKATFKNNGTATQTSFPVTMTITPGGYTNTQTVASLAPGASLQVSFSSWTAAVGTYTVKAIAQLGTDQDRTNDTITITTNVTNAGWLTGTAMSSGSYMGSATGYMRNDTGWVLCTGGNAPNLTSLYIYNARTGAWSTGAAMTTGNVVHSMAVLKDTAYVIGGYGAGTTPTTTFLKYNIRANTWSTGTPLPTAIAWQKSVSYQDSLIYNVGGYDGTNVLSAVSVYNVNTNTWRTCTAMPVGKIGGALARSGDTLVYIAGASISAATSDVYMGVISQTDRSVITWTTKAPYGGGTMYRFDAGSWKPGQIIVGGGSPSTAWTPASPNPAYVYTLSTNTWSALPNVPVPTLGAYTGSVKYSNTYKFVLAGGYSGSAIITNTQVFADVITGIVPVGTEIPKDFSVSQNYPNPFNPVTKIDFALPKSGNVTMKVYNILGKEVATLVNETKNAGNYTVSFNASNLSSGMYFYKIEANGFTEVKKMMLVK